MTKISEPDTFKMMLSNKSHTITKNIESTVSSGRGSTYDEAPIEQAQELYHLEQLLGPTQIVSVAEDVRSGSRHDYQEVNNSKKESCEFFKKRRHVTIHYCVRNRVTASALLLVALLLLQRHQATAFTCYRSPHRVNSELGNNPGLGGDVPSIDNESSDGHQLEIEQRNLRFAGVGRLFTKTDDITDAAKTGVEPHISVVERLASFKVIVIGLGGVGSWAAEALCRSGIGNLVLIDLDDICISNTNRQLHALSSTVGKMKIDEMKRRLEDINPQCNVTLVHDFISVENVDEILSVYSGPRTVCLDAIDSSKAKSALLAACSAYQIPIVTCGGSAGRQDPTRMVCDDLTRVSGDRLLSTCRRNLRKFYGFEEGKSFQENKEGKATRKWNIKAVYSTEPPKSVPQGVNGSSLRRCDGALGTACFVTGAAGFVAAGVVVHDIATNRLVPPIKPRKKQAINAKNRTESRFGETENNTTQAELTA